MSIVQALQTWLRRAALVVAFRTGASGIGAVACYAVHLGAQTPPTQRAALSPHDVQLYAQVLRLSDQRAFDSTTIAGAMRSGSPPVRTAALRALAQLAVARRVQTLPWLRSIAAGSAPFGVPDAAFGLGLARDTSSVELLAALVRGHGPAARPAAWSLGEIGAPAKGRIVALLGGTLPQLSATPDSVRIALLLATAKLRPLPFGAVSPFLSSDDAATRWAAAYAVARQRSPAGARALLYAPQPDAAFRSEIARELTSTTVGDSLNAPAYARLLELCADTDPHVRINAVRSLGSYGSRARAALLGRLRDPDGNVRIAAAQSVAAPFGTDTAAWRAAWSADASYKFRRSLLESAIVAGFPLAADSVWRRSSDWRLRSASVSARAASQDTATSRAVALAAVHDSDGRVRASAYELLAATDTARRDSVVQRVLHAALADPDPVARESLPGYKSRPDSLAARRPLTWYEDVVRRVVIPALSGHPARARLETSRGPITVALLGDEAPLTVFNYLALVQRDFYDGASFHRVVPAFVAQDGDPRGDGNGGPGYSIRDELNLRSYGRGSVGMALSGPDTGGSQYFLTLTPQPHLDGHYTLFATVVHGLTVMDALVEGDRINSIRIQ